MLCCFQSNLICILLCSKKAVLVVWVQPEHKLNRALKFTVRTNYIICKRSCSFCTTLTKKACSESSSMSRDRSNRQLFSSFSILDLKCHSLPVATQMLNRINANEDKVKYNPKQEQLTERTILNVSKLSRPFQRRFTSPMGLCLYILKKRFLSYLSIFTVFLF